MATATYGRIQSKKNPEYRFDWRLSDGQIPEVYGWWVHVLETHDQIVSGLGGWYRTNDRNAAFSVAEDILEAHLKENINVGDNS